MARRTHTIIILGLALGLLIILLVWRAPRESDFTPPSSLLPPPASARVFSPSPLVPPTATSVYSPLRAPPTAPPPITTATLEAIRATRPTATPPSPASFHLPYVSPATWRGWALRILAVAGVLAYVGLRLRRNQKT